MTATIHAFFENGLFRPVEPVDFPERSLVEIEVRTWEEPSLQLLTPEERRDFCVGDAAARHDDEERGS